MLDLQLQRIPLLSLFRMQLTGSPQTNPWLPNGYRLLESKRRHVPSTFSLYWRTLFFKGQDSDLRGSSPLLGRHHDGLCPRVTSEVTCLIIWLPDAVPLAAMRTTMAAGGAISTQDHA